MKGYVTALGLALLLGVAGAASATTAVIDFDNGTNTKDVKLISTNADGKVTMAKVAGRNAAQTTGPSGTPGFLYLGVTPGLFKGSLLYIRVDYLDMGTDQWQLEYATESDAHAAAAPVRYKYDTGLWIQQTFTVVDASLKEQQEGGADLRINDLGDGTESISKVTISDQDLDTVQIPKVDPAHPITIDGVKDKGEWDGAATFTMDRADYDVVEPSKFTSKEEFSATYSYKWDEQNLYILGEVNQMTPRNNSEPGPNYWNGDGTELYIGFDWSDPSHTTYTDGSDFHVFIGLGDKAVGGPGPSWAVAGASATTDDGLVPAKNLSIVKTSTGYLVEMAMPWTLLKPDAKVAENQKIGFSMFANHTLAVGSASSQEMAMSPFKRPSLYLNPSRWATAVLAPVPAQPVTSPPKP